MHGNQQEVNASKDKALYGSSLWEQMEVNSKLPINIYLNPPTH